MENIFSCENFADHHDQHDHAAEQTSWLQATWKLSCHESTHALHCVSLKALIFMVKLITININHNSHVRGTFIIEHKGQKK